MLLCLWNLPSSSLCEGNFECSLKIVETCTSPFNSLMKHMNAFKEPLNKTRSTLRCYQCRHQQGPLELHSADRSCKWKQCINTKYETVGIIHTWWSSKDKSLLESKSWDSVFSIWPSAFSIWAAFQIHHTGGACPKVVLYRPIEKEGS